ncbi:hypothetical protein BDC45DRAFT_513215 [Circinella umbellata]|nr:hypothetical protein BDC45DRAFT_513215 [Circinella umbellata]
MSILLVFFYKYIILKHFVLIYTNFFVPFFNILNTPLTPSLGFKRITTSVHIFFWVITDLVLTSARVTRTVTSSRTNTFRIIQNIILYFGTVNLFKFVFVLSTSLTTDQRQ